MAAVWQFTLTGDIDGQRVQNVMHFEEVTAPTGELPAGQLIAGWYTKFGAAWAACLSAGWHAISYYARKVTPGGSIPLLTLAQGAYALQGTRGDAVCPPQTALLMSLYTEEFGRNGRGRIYMPGVAEADQDAGQITEALITPLDALAALLDDDFPGTTSGTFHQCVFSRVAADGYPVIHAVPQTNIATIRQRRAYPGFIPTP